MSTKGTEMTKSLAPLLVATLMAAGIAHAQTSPTVPAPQSAGVPAASVPAAPMTKTGENTRADVKAEARAANKMGTTSKGAIGTSDAKGQQAGMEPTATTGKTRAELKAERAMKKAEKKADKNLQVMGNTGASSANGEAAKTAQ